MTSTGPTMNTASSMTASMAKAVVRRGRSSRSRWVQRARTSDPVCGVNTPATAAARCGSGSAASRVTASTTAATPIAYPAPASSSTTR